MVRAHRGCIPHGNQQDCMGASCVEATSCNLFRTTRYQQHELEGRLETHRTAIEGWFAEISLDMDTEVIWLGDDSDCGLRMSLGVFLRHFPALLSLPQHSYVVPDEGDWCL